MSDEKKLTIEEKVAVWFSISRKEAILEVLTKKLEIGAEEIDASDSLEDVAVVYDEMATIVRDTQKKLDEVDDEA